MLLGATTIQNQIALMPKHKGFLAVYRWIEKSNLIHHPTTKHFFNITTLITDVFGGSQRQCRPH